MLKNKKLKSFTILEVLISLLIMGIIIGLTYSLFNIVEKQLLTYQKDNNKVLDYNLFNTVFKRDIDASNDFNLNKNIVQLHFYNKDTISYQILNTNVVRHHNFKADTFNVHVINYQLSQLTKKEDLVRVLELKLKLLNDEIEANYFLKKSVSKKINNTYFNED